METIALGFTILGGVGSLVQAGQQADAARSNQSQYEDQQRQVELQAIEDERARREQLTRSLATQDAAGAAMGIDISRSASFSALQSYDKNALNREVMLIRTGAGSSSRRLGMAASAQGSAAGSAQIGGLFSFGRSLFGAYDTATQLATPPTKKVN